MNPNAEPFNPAALILNASAPIDVAVNVTEKKSSNANPNASHRQKSARERRRRQFHLEKVNVVRRVDEPNESSHAKIERAKSTSASQKPTGGIGLRKQRRRQRNKGKTETNHDGYTSDYNTTSQCKINETSSRNIKGSSNSTRNRQRARENRRKQKQRSKRATNIDSATAASKADKFDLDIFPTISSANVAEKSEKISNAEIFWSDRLNSKLIATHVEQETDEDDDAQRVFYNQSSVPLTVLKSRTSLDDANEDDQAKTFDVSDNEQRQQQTSNNTFKSSVNDIHEVNPTPLLSNLKMKWNESQRGKMRKRWWDAERAKRQFEAQRRRIKMEQMQLEHVSDDSSSVSSSSSSSANSFDECDLGMQFSARNTPFDEFRPILPSVQSTYLTVPEIIARPRQSSEQVLEDKCLRSAYPLHLSVYYCYSLKRQSCLLAGGIAPDTTSSDAESVLFRLLMLDDADVDLWKSTTCSLYNFFSDTEEPPIGRDVHLLSVNLEALTPMQLAICLDLTPRMIRILCSTPKLTLEDSKEACMQQDEFGRTPLMLACELHRVECIDTLLSLSINSKLDHRESEGGNSAFHFCCTGTKSVHSLAPDTLELLLNRTPYQLQKRILLSTNNEKQSILHLACASGDLRLVDYILDELNSKGSNFVMKALKTKDANHCVPFISAVKADERDIAMQLLVSRHSNRIDFTTWFDMCPLTIACSNRSVDMIMVLLEVGYHTKYDIHRALLEAVQSDNHNEEENEICRSEIINLLIEAGASPHLPVAITRFPEHHFVTDDQIPTMNRQMNSAHSKTPLMAAVCSGDIIGVKAMLNSYSLALPSLRDARRCDPLIRTQPESYFEMLDRKENDMIESSLQSALVTALYQFSSQGSFSNAGCIALLIYKRGVLLTEKSIQWLSHCLKTNNLYPQPLAVMDEAPIRFKLTVDDCNRDHKSHHEEDSHLIDWSRVLPNLNVLPTNNLRCPTLGRIIREQQLLDCTLRKGDEFYLIVQNEQILAHKSILSAKSGKLAAAIRFNESRLVNEDDVMSIQLHISLADAKILLAHIYHGSILYGWKSGPELKCHQLLELALLAQEYLCPTLILECEMRLLGYGSKDCICHNCMIEKNCLESDGESYIYKIGGPCSSLITPQNALDVLAVAETFAAHQGYYETKCSEKSLSTKITSPFIAAKIAAVKTILTHFKAVCDSDAFLRQTQDNQFDTLSDVGVDESCTMLLSLCLGELKNNPLL